jgi:ankyrin repeat protein
MCDDLRPHPLRPQEGNTALHNAANTGHVDIIRLLLLHGANIDARTKARGCGSWVAPRCAAAAGR